MLAWAYIRPGKFTRISMHRSTALPILRYAKVQLWHWHCCFFGRAEMKRVQLISMCYLGNASQSVGIFITT